ncbi:hypothetical protein LguiA_002571 [Lonicera macranthoides]
MEPLDFYTLRPGETRHQMAASCMCKEWDLILFVRRRRCGFAAGGDVSRSAEGFGVFDDCSE